MKPILATALLASSAMAANPIFQETPYEKCNECLDNVLKKCNGDVESLEFAHCMCDLRPTIGPGRDAYISCWMECGDLDENATGPSDSDIASRIAREHDKYCTSYHAGWCLTDTGEERCKDSGNDDAADSGKSGSPKAAALTGVSAWFMAVGLGLVAVLL